MVFKWCLIGTKGVKVCQKYPPHITPPPPAWTVETRQDGSMLSCSLRQILTLPSECRSRNQDSSDQATFFQSSIVQFWWVCVNCILRFLFLSNRSGTGVVFCCCSPSASGFDVLCVQRWYSAYLGCNEWLFELLLPFYQQCQRSWLFSQQPKHSAAQDRFPTEAKQGWAWSVPGWETSWEN